MQRPIAAEAKHPTHPLDYSLPIMNLFLSLPLSHTHSHSLEYRKGSLKTQLSTHVGHVLQHHLTLPLHTSSMAGPGSGNYLLSSLILPPFQTNLVSPPTSPIPQQLVRNVQTSLLQERYWATFFSQFRASSSSSTLTY